MFKIYQFFRVLHHAQKTSSATYQVFPSFSCSFIRFFCKKDSSIYDLENCDSSNEITEDVKLLLQDSVHKEIQQTLYKNLGIQQGLLLVQPRIKFGAKFETKESAVLKTEEAIALVETLPGWKVIESLVVSITSIQSKVLFGKGNLEMLRTKIKSSSQITGVFIGADLLTALQNVNLEKYFGVQVYDRYQIVLQIFHDHARTKEAKLQVALAEIPYLRIKLAGYSHTFDSGTFNNISLVGGSGETALQKRKEILSIREVKLKKALEKLKKKREFLRKNKKRNEFPIIAVVGYTNCGKTTLIKTLTKDARLVPEDKLFATLDVTLHAGILPSTQKVLYIDTVGFISDVPTSLIQSFKSTLEDIVYSDLIVHVRDISHPQTDLQKDVVLQTLNELGLPQKLIDTIIEVGNKVDKIDKAEAIASESRTDISATKGTNIQTLAEEIENKVLQNTGFSVRLIRIKSGGEEYRWLNKQAAIRDAIVDERDYNYLILEVVISSSNFEIFKHLFGDKSVSLESISLN